MNFAVAYSSPSPRALFVFGWLLMAMGFSVMANIPEEVFERSFERKLRDARWFAGHATLLLAVLCLFTDLLWRKLFP
jgi:nitrate reductase gamma subunit